MKNNEKWFEAMSCILSYGWKESWEELLVVSDISSSWSCLQGHIILTLKMTSAQDVEMAVTINNPSQDSLHQDDQISLK